MVSPTSSIGLYSISRLDNSRPVQVGIQFVSENIVFEETVEIKKTPGSSWEQFRQKVLLSERVYLSKEEEGLLCTECNEFLFRHPCVCLEDYQMRIAELRCMQRALNSRGRLCEVLQQHLLHAEQAIQMLVHNSKNPVQESFWPLYQRILQLPTLQPDFFGAALAVLHEKLPQAIAGEWKDELCALLPRLLPPAHFFYGGDGTELQEVQQACRLLLHRLGEGYSAVFAAPLQTIYETYTAFSEGWERASERRRGEMILPRAQLSGVGLGYFSLDREVGCRLLSRDIAGRNCRTNQLGSHAVHQEEGVFYKPNPEGWFWIGPEMEFAIYALYHLLGGKGTAPASLIKLSHVFFEGEASSYGRVVQAGYGIEGVLLQEMVRMTEALSLLERCFGLPKAKEVLAELLSMKKNDSLIIEGTLEEQAAPFIDRFTMLFSPLPPHKRCLEFIELPVTDICRWDVGQHIAKHSTERLEGVLALLERFPDLAVISGKAGLRNSTLVELTDLWFFLQKIHHHFPLLTPEEIWEELTTWQERWDPTNFSLHFVATLLSRPSDHKLENLMVTWTRSEKGAIQSVGLVGIDNDLAFKTNPRRHNC